jgi:hypothetical protein
MATDPIVEKLTHALRLLEDVDSIVQSTLNNNYDLYENINLLMDQIRDRAEEEGIELPE